MKRVRKKYWIGLKKKNAVFVDSCKMHRFYYKNKLKIIFFFNRTLNLLEVFVENGMVATVHLKIEILLMLSNLSYILLVDFELLEINLNRFMILIFYVDKANNFCFVTYFSLVVWINVYVKKKRKEIETRISVLRL